MKAEPPRSSRLGLERALAVLAGLAIVACDKTSAQAAPEPVPNEVKLEASAAPALSPVTDVEALPAARAPVVEAKEVAAAATSAAAPSAVKVPAAVRSAKAQEKSCAPGGCAPGKCGGSKP